MQVSSGTRSLRNLSEDGNRVLQGMPGKLRGLYGPMYLLQIPTAVSDLGVVPKERKEVSARKGGQRRLVVQDEI